jgi:tetratricopeptide (TPR) repeat protein
VRGNPLENVAHADALEGVLLAGCWLPAAELSARLERLRDLYEGEPEFLALLREDGVAAAAERWREARARDPAARLFREGALDSIGYELLEAGRTSEALAAFELNVEAYPDSPDVYGSRGEARAAAGDTDGALADFERSLALNPWNANATTMLEALRG